jgi:N utilization substance protein B
MGARRKGREAALQILFQIDVSSVTPTQAAELFFGHLAEDHEGEVFARGLIETFDKNRGRIDTTIRDASQNWRIDRMSRVDRNILRLGAAELLSSHDIPRRVTLNEAVELAKRFGNEQSASFVNGVLDRVATDLGRE